MKILQKLVTTRRQHTYTPIESFQNANPVLWPNDQNTAKRQDHEWLHWQIPQTLKKKNSDLDLWQGEHKCAICMDTKKSFHSSSTEWLTIFCYWTSILKCKRRAPLLTWDLQHKSIPPHSTLIHRWVPPHLQSTWDDCLHTYTSSQTNSVQALTKSSQLPSLNT